MGRKKSISIDEVYKAVFIEVSENQLTLVQAFKKVGITSKSFYRLINLEQRKNIRIACLNNSTVGASKSNSGLSLRRSRDIIEGIEYLTTNDNDD